jgi:hypothetical protein
MLNIDTPHQERSDSLGWNGKWNPTNTAPPLNKMRMQFLPQINEPDLLHIYYRKSDSNASAIKPQLVLPITLSSFALRSSSLSDRTLLSGINVHDQQRISSLFLLLLAYHACISTLFEPSIYPRESRSLLLL